jgi:predicted nucleic acid-binding protein
MTVVVDANILVVFGLADEPLHVQAQQALVAWMDAGVTLAAPQLFRSEITAVIRKVVYQQRITHEEGRAMVVKLLRYPVECHEDDDLLQAAYELAAIYNRPRAYDAQYMALAQRLSCELWTADERLYNAVKGGFPNIRWLGDWPSEA